MCIYFSAIYIYIHNTTYLSLDSEIYTKIAFVLYFEQSLTKKGQKLCFRIWRQDLHKFKLYGKSYHILILWIYICVCRYYLEYNSQILDLIIYFQNTKSSLNWFAIYIFKIWYSIYLRVLPPSQFPYKDFCIKHFAFSTESLL